MSTNHHTPWVDGTTTFSAVDMNAPLSELDAAITTNASAISGKAATAHTHDDRYFTETELSTSAAGGAVHWDNVTNKPSLGTGDGDVVAPASHAADYVPQWNSTADSKILVAGFPITAVGKAILDDDTAADQRTTLGVDAVGVGVSYQSGDKPAAGAIINILVPHGVTFPSGLTGSAYYGATAPTAEAVVSIKKNGTEFGTLTVSTGNSGTFAATSASTFAAGDRLSLAFPASQDATWAGAAITLKGVRA